MANKSMGGWIRVKITSADIPGALRQLAEHNIILQDIESENDLSVSLTVSQRDFQRVKALLEKRGDRCQAEYRSGLYWTLLKLKSRWLFVMGCIIIIMLSIFIPSRIYFFEVKGNHSIPQRWILEQAELSGLSFGCNRAQIKSEQLKNSILQSIPELDWVGITTAGCVATIEVREKPLEEKRENNIFSVSHIVAACDGVVDSITATNGVSLCKPGQAVQKGQILISGYENCGLIVKASRAEGEVYAKTIRTISLYSPANRLQRGEIQRVEKKYSVQIGKNIINFSKDSGISPAGCVKMYSRKYVTLPGGFQLPIALICQKTVYCESYLTEASEEDFAWLEKDAEQYILSHMNAGEILLRQTALQYSQDFCVLNGVYACREQIGKTKIEEILNQNGKYS